MYLPGEKKPKNRPEDEKVDVRKGGSRSKNEEGERERKKLQGWIGGGIKTTKDREHKGPVQRKCHASGDFSKNKERGFERNGFRGLFQIAS